LINSNEAPESRDAHFENHGPTLSITSALWLRTNFSRWLLLMLLACSSKEDYKNIGMLFLCIFRVLKDSTRPVHQSNSILLFKHPLLASDMITWSCVEDQLRLEPKRFVWSWKTRNMLSSSYIIFLFRFTITLIKI